MIKNANAINQNNSLILLVQGHSYTTVQFWIMDREKVEKLDSMLTSKLAATEADSATVSSTDTTHGQSRLTAETCRSTWKTGYNWPYWKANGFHRKYSKLE